MRIISNYLLVFILSLVSPALWAFSGSLLDPDLSIEVEDKARWQGSIRFRGIRNARIPFDTKHLWQLNHRNSVFGAMGVKGDLKLNYLLSKKYSLFASLDYERQAVAAPQELADSCWGAYLCIGDMSVGVSIPSFFKRGNFQLKSSFYLSLPTSRTTVKSGSLGGPGALLRSRWRLLSHSYLHLSAVSSHFLDTNIPFVKLVGNGSKTFPTLLDFFNQPGLSFRYTGSFSWFFPVLYVYGSLRNILHTDFKFRSAFRLRASAAWTTKKKFRVAAGLQWGERLVQKNGVKGKVIGNRVFADRTYFTLGVSYAF